jgi:hypothetical protein
MTQARAIVGGLIAIAGIVAACGASPGTTPGPLETASIAAAASATPAVAAVTSPVDGVLTHIDAAGLSKVTGFTLRLATGRQITFRIGILENGDQFPPGHLAEHLATSAPIRVYFRPDGPDLVVYRLEDAPPT